MLVPLAASHRPFALRKSSGIHRLGKPVSSMRSIYLVAVLLAASTSALPNGVGEKANHLMSSAAFLLTLPALAMLARISVF